MTSSSQPGPPGQPVPERWLYTATIVGLIGNMFAIVALVFDSPRAFAFGACVIAAAAGIALLVLYWKKPTGLPIVLATSFIALALFIAGVFAGWLAKGSSDKPCPDGNCVITASSGPASSAVPIPSTSSPTPSPAATLENVADNGEVSDSLVVEGTVTGLPDDRHLWAVLRPEGSDYYPQGPSPIVVDSTGSWTMRCNFGNSDDDIGKKFQLIIVAVTDAGNEVFVKYHEDGVAVNWTDYPGLAALPLDTLTLTEITVTRV